MKGFHKRLHEVKKLGFFEFMQPLAIPIAEKALINPKASNELSKVVVIDNGSVKL